MTVKRIYTILVSLILCAVSVSAADDAQPFVLVLDPGHGGRISEPPVRVVRYGERCGS